jgi:tRNA(fMet)-specific endonuclease VapC
MLLYMLDTDIVSYITKRSNLKVLDRLREASTSATCISAIAESELRFGVDVSPRRDKDETGLSDFLQYMQVLDFPVAAARDYGEIRGHLHRSGSMIGGNDLLIAAHARCLGLTLVTNNMREFSRVPGLKTENWA